MLCRSGYRSSTHNRDQFSFQRILRVAHVSCESIHRWSLGFHAWQVLLGRKNPWYQVHDELHCGHFQYRQCREDVDTSVSRWRWDSDKSLDGIPNMILLMEHHTLFFLSLVLNNGIIQFRRVFNSSLPLPAPINGLLIIKHKDVSIKQNFITARLTQRTSNCISIPWQWCQVFETSRAQLYVCAAMNDAKYSLLTVSRILEMFS